MLVIYLEILQVMSISVIFIFSYGKYRSFYPNYRDPFMTKLGIGDLDYWSVLHLLWYALMGYLYPKYDCEILSMSIGWEIFEHWMGENRPSILGGFGDCPDNLNAIGNQWWYGRWSDILINMVGFYTVKSFNRI